MFKYFFQFLPKLFQSSRSVNILKKFSEVPEFHSEFFKFLWLIYFFPISSRLQILKENSKLFFFFSNFWNLWNFLKISRYFEFYCGKFQKIQYSFFKIQVFRRIIWVSYRYRSNKNLSRTGFVTNQNIFVLKKANKLFYSRSIVSLHFIYHIYNQHDINLK